MAVTHEQMIQTYLRDLLHVVKVLAKDVEEIKKHLPSLPKTPKS